MIDEADEAMPGMAVGAAGGSSPKRSKREASEQLPNSPARKKRKPGPLPKHITLSNRPTTPPITTPPPTPPVSNGDSSESFDLVKKDKAKHSNLQSVCPFHN